VLGTTSSWLELDAHDEPLRVRSEEAVSVGVGEALRELEGEGDSLAEGGALGGDDAPARRALVAAITRFVQMRNTLG
jgi:hypothetical protein